MLKRLLLLAIAITAIPSVAMINDSVSNRGLTNKALEISSTVITDSLSEDDILEAQASIWGITVDDWQQYQTEMQGIAGVLYSHMLPIEVLVLTEDDPEKRDRYLDIAVEQLKQHVERTLAYEVDITEKLFKTYADLPVIEEFDLRPFSPLYKKPLEVKPNNRLILFTDVFNPGNWSVVPKLVNLLKNSNKLYLDIYLVKAQHHEIQAWAKQHHVPMDLVSKETITLNYDDGSLFQRTVGEIDILPNVLLFDGEKTKAISVYDL